MLYITIIMVITYLCLTALSKLEKKEEEAKAKEEGYDVFFSNR